MCIRDRASEAHDMPARRLRDKTACKPAVAAQDQATQQASNELGDEVAEGPEQQAHGVETSQGAVNFKPKERKEEKERNTIVTPSDDTDLDSLLRVRTKERKPKKEWIVEVCVCPYRSGGGGGGARRVARSSWPGRGPT